MNKNFIHVVAENEHHDLYNSLPRRGTEIRFHSIQDYLKPIPRNELGVFILDCGYKVKMGLRIVKEMKIMWPDIPIVFVTDVSSESTAIDAFRLGARDYFKKPVDLSQLKDTVERLLKLRAGSAEKRTQVFDRRRLSGERNLFKVKSDAPANIIRSISFIEEKLPDMKAVSLEELSKKANLSKYHYCRAFKKTTGMTPMQFVTHLRINRAKDLLRRRDNNISRIAIEVGFNDFSNFIRHFKKITGVTPKKFRTSFRVKRLSRKKEHI